MNAIRLRKAKPQDAVRIWKWRNDPLVRKVSFQTTRIPLSDHKEWFGKKIKDPNTRILIGETSNGQPFGYARIDNLSAEVHIAVQKAYRGKGLGQQLLKKACQYGFKKMKLKTIYARIKPSNKRSIELFQSIGFKKSGKPVNSLAFKLRALHE